MSQNNADPLIILVPGTSGIGKVSIDPEDIT